MEALQVSAGTWQRQRYRTWCCRRPAPGAVWLRSLPGGKLPDRGDFKAWGDDESGRQAEWRKSFTERQRLADEFAAVGSSGRGFDALPLAWDLPGTAPRLNFRPRLIEQERERQAGYDTADYHIILHRGL